MQKFSHPFHLANPSPWPLLVSILLLSSVITLVSLISFKKLNRFFLLVLISMVLISSLLWWKDVKRESNYLGEHSNIMINLLKFRIVLFIVSEVMFFVRFFWAFFHLRISPDIVLGGVWPPSGITIFNPIGMPLINSLVLLSSGCTVTWSHHFFIQKNVKGGALQLIFTIMLGVIFSTLQGVEYYNSNFCFSDSCYGSAFFLTTGFHGIHVLIGSMFLLFTLSSITFLENSNFHFISFDLSAWYWHFVDVVWLFLYSAIYWWGSLI